MESIRKWFYKPKKDDTSLLAQFFYADEALNLVAAELDSFDGRKDPERCSALVNHLRQCQDKVLSICNRIMDESIPGERANRDFRAKFPDDVMQENLAGQLWFGAECLAAGSSIMNRESESASMRPLAKALTKSLENVRNLLREQCLRGYTIVAPNDLFTERVQEALKIFDSLFAEFELKYVSAMVPVKTVHEYDMLQLVIVLFSETLQRALDMKLLTQELIDDYDPALMFTIPRLAIVCGLLIFPDGPLCLDKPPMEMSEMFRPFRTLLYKIRELLWTLNKKELYTLEKLLCSSEELDYSCPNDSDLIEPDSDPQDGDTYQPSYPTVPDLDDFVKRFYSDYPNCKDYVSDFYTVASDKEDVKDCNVETEHSATWEHPEDSEDETEWVGEASECETLMTEILNTDDVPLPCAPVEGNMAENEASVVPNLKSSTTFTMNIQCNSSFHPCIDNCSLSSDCTCYDTSSLANTSNNGSQITVVSTLPFPSSTLIATDFSIADEERYPSNNEVYRENSGRNSFSVDISSENSESTQNLHTTSLVGNRIGLDVITADGLPSRIASSDLQEPSSDELTNEAVSETTASLSTLLLNQDSDALINSLNQHVEVEDDTNTHSPIDSGVGTVVSCSDTGSFSDRSPEAAQAEYAISSPKTSPEHQSCVCGVSSTSTAQCEKNPNEESSAPFSSKDSNRAFSCSAECVVSSSVSCDKSQISSQLICDKNSISIKDGRSSRTYNAACVTSHPGDNCLRNSASCDSGEDRASVFCREGEVLAENHLLSCVNCALINKSCEREIRTEECFEVNVPNSATTRSVDETRRNGEQVVPSLCISSDELESCRENSCFGGAALEGSLSRRYLSRRSSLHEKPSIPQKGNKSGFLQSEKKQVPCSAVDRSVQGTTSRALQLPVLGRYASSCLSSRSSLTASSDSCSMSSDTSSFNSDCQDDEEIALAMQAAEIANRNEIRAKFRSSEDLVHRLFVCIAGVADQLQTNFAGDLRNILKCVFLMSAVNNSNNSSLENDSDNQGLEQDSSSLSDNDSNRVENAEEAWESPLSPADLESPPPWVPDGEAPRCMSCESVFTVVRRRHHCRNCGKVFCARCSSNSVPLPRFGHMKPVRVCNRCFLYQVTPFTVEDMTAAHS